MIAINHTACPSLHLLSCKTEILGFPVNEAALGINHRMDSCWYPNTVKPGCGTQQTWEWVTQGRV